MRGLTAEEYEVMRDLIAQLGPCNEPECCGIVASGIVASDDQCEAMTRLRDRGYAVDSDCAYDQRIIHFEVTPLGREAMRIHEAITAMVST
jgi:hypothetical protein